RPRERVVPGGARDDAHVMGRRFHRLDHGQPRPRAGSRRRSCPPERQAGPAAEAPGAGDALTSLRGRPGGFTTSTDRSGVIERVRRVWEYRRILALLIGRDLKVRYAGSALGYFWSIPAPLLMSAVYWVVFTKIFTRSVGYEPYIVFLLSGQLPWQWFNMGVTSSARALRTAAKMVRSTNVPREVRIGRNVASTGVQYLLSLPVLAAFAIGTQAAPNIDIVFMPLAIAMQTVLLVGIGLCLAPITVLVRDIE